MNWILYFVEAIFIAYFLYVCFYTFILGLFSRFYRVKKESFNQPKSSFAVLIPAYKEDGVIVSVAESAVKHNYPKDKFDVYVIADSLQSGTLKKLRAIEDLKIVEVSFEKSTKVKALNKTLQFIEDSNLKYDHATILDADNLMEENYLNWMNAYHEKGYVAIQGQRASKNESKQLSFLDGLSESLNNSIYGKGSMIIDWSASLKGSGMSFDFYLLKNELSKMDSIGGFDRELEHRITSLGNQVYYLDTAVVYDEKVEKSEVFKNQRKRWISSQYIFLASNWKSGVKALFRGDLRLFNSILLRNVQLPRLLNIGILHILFLVHVGLYFASFSVPSAFIIVWISLTVVFDLGILFAIPNRYYRWQMLKSIVRLPLIFWQMFLLLFKLKGANKKFIHTPHGES